MEASVMLAKLMGLTPLLFSDMCHFHRDGEEFVSVYPHGWYHRMPVDEAWVFFPNLYIPVNMALAWRVLNWATMEPTAQLAQVARWFLIGGGMSLLPTQAQRAWLDKIISLAIEAGMVDAAAKG